MNQTKKLQSKLVKHLDSLSITPNQVKDRKQPNPFPIGTKAVYVMAKYGRATDSHKWKLFEFFNNLK